MAVLLWDSGVWGDDWAASTGGEGGGGDPSEPAVPLDALEMLVLAQGDRHRVYIDGRLLIDIEDSDLNDQPGAGLLSQGATTHTFDDFYANGL